MVVIGGKKYYTTEESAALAGISIRTLRRWLAAGRLSDFIYPFRAGPGEVLYRLEAPCEDDERNEKGEYVVHKGAGEAEGGAADEGNSGS